MQGSQSNGADALQILLIEDNPGDARLFEELLGESPVEGTLRHESRLDAGLSALREDQPDVLVLDLGLPDSEGPGTVDTVDAAAPSVPIVVLTGQNDLEAVLQAQEAGAAEYLQKEELTPALVGRTLRWAVQRSRMQAKLRQQDAWIRSLTENVSAGMFRAGPTGQIEFANEALLEMLGYEREELIGQDLTTLSAEPTQQGQMLAEESAEGTEIALRRKDGSVLVGLLSAEAAYDAKGEVLHYDGVTPTSPRRSEPCGNWSEASSSRAACSMRSPPTSWCSTGTARLST
jgi:PAS domain S-box-containing protein